MFWVKDTIKNYAHRCKVPILVKRYKKGYAAIFFKKHLDRMSKLFICYNPSVEVTIFMCPERNKKFSKKENLIRYYKKTKKGLEDHNG